MINGEKAMAKWQNGNGKTAKGNVKTATVKEQRQVKCVTVAPWPPGPVSLYIVQLHCVWQSSRSGNNTVFCPHLQMRLIEG